MPTSDSLMGYGMPAQQASQLGSNPSQLTTTGTSQTTAATLKLRNTELVTAASQTGAIPVSTSGVFDLYFITNPTATTAVIYVPVGHNLNSSLNGSLNLAQFKTCIFYQYKPKNWTYILTA